MQYRVHGWCREASGGGRETVVLPHVRVNLDADAVSVGALLVRRAFEDARAARAAGRSALPWCSGTGRWAQLQPRHGDVARRPMIRERTFTRRVTGAELIEEMTADRATHAADARGPA